MYVLEVILSEAIFLFIFFITNRNSNNVASGFWRTLDLLSASKSSYEIWYRNKMHYVSWINGDSDKKIGAPTWFIHVTVHETILREWIYWSQKYRQFYPHSNWMKNHLPGIKKKNKSFSNFPQQISSKWFFQFCTKLF